MEHFRTHGRTLVTPYRRKLCGIAQKYQATVDAGVHIVYQIFKQVASRGVSPPIIEALVDDKHCIVSPVFSYTHSTALCYAVAAYIVDAAMDGICLMTGECAEHLGRAAGGSHKHCAYAHAVESAQERAHSEVLPVPA